MKIYFSPWSPFVRKCLVAAKELGIDARIELLPSNAHPIDRDREIIEKNPLGQVPTLLADDGQVLHDSRVICEYLDELAQGSLFPRNGRERWLALSLQSLGDGMSDAALLARYEDVARPEAIRWADWRAAQLDKVNTSLKALDAAPHQLTGRIDIGAIAIGCALWYLDLRFDGFGWRERYPAVNSWYSEFGRRPSMVAI
jgi:glutathione S-transferase